MPIPAKVEACVNNLQTFNDRFLHRFFLLLVCVLLSQSCATVQKNPQIVNFLQDGRKDELEAMLNEENVNTKDKDGQSLLHIAARQNNIEEVAIFLKKGAKLDSLDSNGKTPLLVALERRNLAIAKFLAERGANIFIVDNFGHSPFSYAKEVSLLDHILNSQTITQKDASGKIAIYYAVESYDVGLAKKILSLGVPAFGLKADENSLLKIAYKDTSKKEAARMASLLLLSGAEPLNDEFKEFEKAVIKRNYGMRFADGMTALHIVAAKNNLGFVDYLIEEGCPVNAKNVANSTALHEAVRNGNTICVSHLLEKGADPTLTDSFGNSCLHIVMPKEKRLEIFKLLLEKVLSCNIKDSFGETPLHIAIRLRYELDVIKLLVEKGGNIEEKNKRGEVPLYIAIQTEQEEISKYLASIGANIHSANIDGKTPFISSFTKKFELFKSFLNKDNISSKDANGSSCLHIAVLKNASSEFVEYIIENSNLISSIDMAGNTPLHLAVDLDNEKLGRVLINNDASIFSLNDKGYSSLVLAIELGGKRWEWFFNEKTMKVKDAYGNTALHIAARNGYAHVIGNMVEAGAAIMAINNNSETAIFSALKKDSYNVIKVLLSFSDNQLSYISKRDFLGNTALHASVKEKAYNSAKLLLSIAHGAHPFVNFGNMAGSTALHEAASVGDETLIKLLLAYNADITSQDNSGKSPLSRAILANKFEAARLLLISGSSPVQQDMNGSTPMHEAISMVQNIYDKSIGLKMIRMLRLAGGNPMARDVQGRTPLSMALEKDVALIQAILGNDKFLSDSDGRTPLHIAIIEGAKGPIISFLLKKGYPINKRDSQGETALFCAIDRLQTENSQMLFEAGSDPFIANNAGENAVTLILKKREDFIEMLARNSLVKTDAIGDNILHYAARFAERRIIEVLLSITTNGIDEKNTLGETPYQVALHWQEKDVASLFEIQNEKNMSVQQEEKNEETEKNDIDEVKKPISQ